MKLIDSGKYIDDYIDYISQVKSLNHNTVKSYRQDLLSWKAFLEHNATDILISSKILPRSYVAHLSQRGLQRTSINRQIASLRSFYKYLVSQKLLESNPLEHLRKLKAQRRLPKFLTSEEFDQLLEHVGTGFYGARNLFILEFLFSTGCRVSELCKLNIENLLNSYILIQGKGDKQRHLFMGSFAKQSLLRYKILRDQQKAVETRALLLNNKKQRLSSRGVFYILEQIAKKANLQHKLSPHMFRHGFATELLNNGADIRSVQDFLGHSSLSSTQIYTHISIDRLKPIIRNAHPHGQRKFVNLNNGDKK